MSQASLAAYDRILPEIPRLEGLVLSELRRQMEGSIGGRFGQMTCRAIARKLGKERDSISPRIGALQNKGLVVEVGIEAGQSLYEIVLNPNYEKAPKRPKSRQYKKAIEDAARMVEERYAAFHISASIRSLA